MVAQFAAVAPSGQRNIAWDEFCAGPATAHQLAQAMLDGKARAIPHAVWGPASTAEPSARGDSHVVRYAARHPVLIEGRPVKVNVAVRCKAGEWIGAEASSGMFLGYGYWELFPKDADGAHKAAERGWIELQLWVKEPWQVERWGTQHGSAPLPHPTPPRRRPAPPPVPRPTSAPPPVKLPLPAEQQEGTTQSAERADEPTQRHAAPASTTPPDTGAPAAEPTDQPAVQTAPAPDEPEQQRDPRPTEPPQGNETPAPSDEGRPVPQVPDAPVPPPAAGPQIPPPPPCRAAAVRGCGIRRQDRRSSVSSRVASKSS
ncbi:hypothetical protein, partial [Streptomyces sp. NPDC048644]|uniref:hypothetical protein n=1 Tax=Streptomyces sp. NPDC048644 TaxID=3365582 RepID=UPI00371B4409